MKKLERRLRAAHSLPSAIDALLREYAAKVEAWRTLLVMVRDQAEWAMGYSGPTQVPAEAERTALHFIIQDYRQGAGRRGDGWTLS